MARRRVMEAVESHAVEIDGDSWMIRAGERLVAGHPAVTKNPRFFAEARPDDELSRGLGPEKREPERQSKSRPQVRAKGYLRAPGVVLGGGYVGEGVTVVHQGDILPADHPMIKVMPQNFEPVE